jgi:31-O-methyltransferase
VRLIGRRPVSGSVDQPNIESIAAGLRHYDREQLAFQIKEIISEGMYVRHGLQVGPGDVVFDVGANAGVAAVSFAISGAGAVHSFEPVPPLFDLLADNIRAYPACEVHRFALGASEGRATVTFYPDVAVMSGLHADVDRDAEMLRRAMINMGTSADEALERVPTLRAESFDCETTTVSRMLSELSLDAIDLLKVDVEHAEIDVLAGIEPDDWPRIRQLVIEVHSDDHAAVIEDLLGANGFAYVWERDEALTGTEVRIVYAKRR